MNNVFFGFSGNEIKLAIIAFHNFIANQFYHFAVLVF